MELSILMLPTLIACSQYDCGCEPNSRTMTSKSFSPIQRPLTNVLNSWTYGTTERTPSVIEYSGSRTPFSRLRGSKTFLFIKFNFQRLRKQSKTLNDSARLSGTLFHDSDIILVATCGILKLN